MADESPKVTIEFAARSIGFIDGSTPYLSFVTTDKQHYVLHLSTLQIALLSQETAKFSAEKIRQALANLATHP